LLLNFGKPHFDVKRYRRAMNLFIRVHLWLITWAERSNKSSAPRHRSVHLRTVTSV
jgi:hypothetical protein